MSTYYKVNVYKTERKKDGSYEESVIGTTFVRNYLLFAKSAENDTKYPILNDTYIVEPSEFEDEPSAIYSIYDICDIDSDCYFENTACSINILTSTLLEQYQVLPSNLIGKAYVKKSELTKENKYFTKMNLASSPQDGEKPVVLVKK